MPARSRSPLALWHLLSLDAATVAACWTSFFAWSAGQKLPFADPLAIFLAVWILYAADRLLDAQPVFNQVYGPEMGERHRFHHANRQRFVLAMVVVALPLLVLLHAMDATLLRAYVLLACALGAWLTLVHLRPGASGSAHRLPKELAVGIFFPLATSLPTAVRLDGRASALLLPATLFGLLCTLNCLFLSAWEHPGGRTQAHFTARWGTRHLRSLALLYTFGTATLLLLHALPSMPLHAFSLLQLLHANAWLAACSLSGTLLLLVHAGRHRIRATELRACADLALLTPLLLLAMARVLHG